MAATLVFELFNEGQLIRMVLIICQCLAYKRFLMSSEIFAAILSWKLLLSPFCRLLAKDTVLKSYYSVLGFLTEINWYLQMIFFSLSLPSCIITLFWIQRMASLILKGSLGNFYLFWEKIGLLVIYGIWWNQYKDKDWGLCGSFHKLFLFCLNSLPSSYLLSISKTNGAGNMQVIFSFQNKASFCSQSTQKCTRTVARILPWKNGMWSCGSPITIYMMN